MPLLTLHLLRLAHPVSVESFLGQLTNTAPAIDIVVASRPRHYVIHTEILDKSSLTNTPWDLMLLVRTSDGNLPESARTQVEEEYKVIVGIPSKLLAAYPEKDHKLKKNAKYAQLTGSLEKARVPESSQNLELSPDLLKFMDELMKEYDGPVTMLNLLHFNEGGKPEYYKYGQVRISDVLGWRVGILMRSRDSSKSRAGAAVMRSWWATW